RLKAGSNAAAASTCLKPANCQTPATRLNSSTRSFLASRNSLSQALLMRSIMVSGITGSVASLPSTPILKENVDQKCSPIEPLANRPEGTIAYLPFEYRVQNLEAIRLHPRK